MKIGRHRRRVISAIGLLSCLGLGTVSSQPECSISPSRQFVIYGANASLRGAVSGLAEQVKTNLLRLLGASDQWKTPIVINLQQRQANVPELPGSSLRFSQTGAGLKLQLDFTLAADAGAHLLQRQILRAILLERIYRQHDDIAPGTPYTEPPSWLVEAVLAKIQEAEQAPTFVPSSLPSLGEFLRQQPELLDPVGSQIYRVCSAALLLVLNDGAEGAARLNSYIENLASSSSDPVADLKTLFPAFSAADLEKHWQTTIRKSADVQSFALLSFSDTERRLAEALRLQVAGKSVTLEALAKARPGAREKSILTDAARSLTLLAATANPVLRPVINEYQQISQSLARAKWKGQAERLARVHALEKRLSTRMEEVDDYMNWFEATQVPTASGLFNDYFGTARQPEDQTRRRDGLSVYLDAVEMELQN